MSILTLLILCLGAFASLQFFFIPRLRLKCSIDRRPGMIGHAAKLSLLELLRNTTAISAVALAAMLVAGLLLTISGRNDVDTVAASITRLQRWQQLLRNFSGGWSVAASLLLIASLAIYSHRKTKRRFESLFRRKYEEEFERLRGEADAGKLEWLPPSAEMEAIDQQVERGRELHAAMSASDQQVSAEDFQKLSEHIYRLMLYRQALDIARRVDVQLDEDDVKLPEPETAGEKVQTFLISRGMMQTLNGASRAVFVAAMLLLVPSLAGVAAGTALPSLQTKIADLRKVQIQLTRADWSKLKESLGQEKQELTREDEEAISDIASAYENATASNPRWASAQPAAAAYRMRAALVADRIATKTRQARPEQYSQYASGARADNLSEAEKAFTEAAESTLEARGPVTPEGLRVQEELRDAARRSPTFRQRLRNTAHAFQDVAGGRAIHRSLMSQLLSAVGGGAPGPFGEVLSGVRIAEVRPHAAWYSEASRHEFLATVLKGGDVGEALRTAGSPHEAQWLAAADLAEMELKLREAVERLPFEPVADKLRERPAGIEVVADSDVNWNKAGQQIANIWKSVPEGTFEAERLTESLATYRDHFPNQPGADAESPRSKLAAVLTEREPPPESGGPSPFSPSGPGPNRGPARPSSPDGPGSSPFSTRAGETLRSSVAEGPVVRASAPSTPSPTFTRARSFSRLRGFARVGGVLIGRPAESAFAVRDLRWEIEGKQIRLILIGADGKVYRSAPHRASLVYQALSYAADGRPVAVTMTTARPLLDLKIHLHPALVDTPLGQRVIEIDRFVDTYARGRHPGIDAAEKAVADEYALYRFAWAHRVIALDLRDVIAQGETSSDPETRQAAEAVKGLLAYAERLVADEALVTSAASAWRRREIIFRGAAKDSLIRSKTSHFDPDLIASLAANANAATLAGLVERIHEQPHAGNEQLRKMLAPPPEFEVWSGVRERRFDGSPQTLLATNAASQAKVLDFILQVAFTSDPAFGSADVAEEEEPWMFPRVEGDIQKQVEAAAAGSSKVREIIADVTEFTILQRLFRSALNGQLGQEFPVEKLVSLMAVVEKNAPANVRTARWTVRPFELLAARHATEGEERKRVEQIIALRQSLGLEKDDRAALVGETRFAPIE